MRERKTGLMGAGFVYRVTGMVAYCVKKKKENKTNIPAAAM